MQHHARKRPARPLAPMRAAFLRLHQQTFRLQEGLRPCVAPREFVIAHQKFVKMLRREAAVPCPVKRLDLGLPVERNPLAGRLPEPAVQKSRFAILVVALPPAPKRPLPDAQELRRLQLTELRRLVTPQNIQKLDHSHTLMGFRPAHREPRKARQLPDRSCAT